MEEPKSGRAKGREREKNRAREEERKRREERKGREKEGRGEGERKKKKTASKKYALTTSSPERISKDNARRIDYLLQERTNLLRNK